MQQYLCTPTGSLRTVYTYQVIVYTYRVIVCTYRIIVYTSRIIVYTNRIIVYAYRIIVHTYRLPDNCVHLQDHNVHLSLLGHYVLQCTPTGYHGYHCVHLSDIIVYTYRPLLYA